MKNIYVLLLLISIVITLSLVRLANTYEYLRSYVVMYSIFQSVVVLSVVIINLIRKVMTNQKNDKR